MKVVLIGGGEHAQVVADAARLAGFTVVGYADTERRATADAAGMSWLGPDEEAAAEARRQAAPAILALASQHSLALRRSLVETWSRHSVPFAIVVHPRAIVARSAHLEPGVVVLAGAIVNPGARVDSHAIINSGAIVEHDVRIGVFTHVAPGCVIGGGATIGEGCFLGLGARIRDHVTVGPEATVGMGSVLVEDVPRGAVVMGVPARPVK